MVTAAASGIAQMDLWPPLIDPMYEEDDHDRHQAEHVRAHEELDLPCGDDGGREGEPRVGAEQVREDQRREAPDNDASGRPHEDMGATIFEKGKTSCSRGRPKLALRLVNGSLTTDDRAEQSQKFRSATTLRFSHKVIKRSRISTSDSSECYPEFTFTVAYSYEFG
jgi:hypothetical protein